MADNFTLSNNSGSKKAATDEVTYSGDTADVQLMRIVGVTGSEGSKTVVDLPGDATNGLDVDVTRMAALVAGTALIGKIAAGLSTSEMYNGSTSVSPSYATIDTATSGDVTIIDPGAGKKVRVLAFNLIAVGTAVSVYFKTGSTGKFGSSSRPLVLDKTGATGPAGFNSGFCPAGWFEGAADENLVLNLSAAQGVIGNVVYLEL